MNSLIGWVVLGLNVFATVDIFKGSFSTGKKVLWAAVV